MASTAASFEDVESALAKVYLGQRYQQYLSVSMASWFVWDHIVTFDQELHYVWKMGAWTAIKVLFVAVRYGISVGYPAGLYAIFSRADTPHICPISNVFIIWFVILGHAIQVILALRVWALYYRNRWVGACLLLGFFALFGVSLNLSISYMLGGKSPIPPVVAGSPQLFGCLMNPIPGYYRTIVATTVFETAVFGLTLWKVFRQQQVYRQAPLLNHIIASGVVYYVAMLAMLVINLLTKPFPVLEIPILSSSCILAVQGVACCRIVLGMLRCAAQANHAAETTYRSRLEETSKFFSVPAGIYTKEMMEKWEYGLPPLEMGDPLEGKDFPMVPLVTIDASSGQLDN